MADTFARDAAELQNRFRTAFLNIRSQGNKALLRAGLVVAGQAQRNVSGPRPGNLGVVTNRLRSSITAVLVSYGVVRVGTNVEYAAIHEYGGMVFAKHPIRMVTRSGRVFYTARPWLRFQTRDGHWRVVDRVRIPRRPYLHPALEAKRAQCVRIIRQVYAGPLHLGGQAA